jgi:hypothetical protein
MRSLLAGAALLCLAAPARADVPVTLRGSPASMERQHRVAREHGLPFARTPAQVRALAREGKLVALDESAALALLPGLSHPVAHPTAALFLARTAEAYRAACGERLVVTSLTRAASGQPANAHPLSVHPTGIAVDLRIPRVPRCRAWLEATLLGMEAEAVLDVTREERPPHYHVALFPEPYLAWLERTQGPPLREVPPPPPLEDLPAGLAVRWDPVAPAVGTMPAGALQRLGAAGRAAVTGALGVLRAGLRAARSA